jgi:hypothetical protein
MTATAMDYVRLLAKSRAGTRWRRNPRLAMCEACSTQNVQSPSRRRQVMITKE